MKLVLISNSFGSLYNFRYELICELLNKYQVTIMTPMDEADYPLYEGLKEKGLKLVVTDFRRRGKNPFKDLALYQNYKRELKALKPDLVMTYTIKPNVYGGLACGKLKIPYCANITGLGTAFQKEGMLKNVSIFLYRKGLKRAETVFFQNKESQETFKKYCIGGKNAVLVPGSGINLSKFSYHPYPIERQNAFLYVARIMKEKGAEEFFYMAEQMKKRHPEVSFDVVGFCEESYEAKLKELEEEGVLVSHGWQNDILPYLKNAGCVVQPSYHEGLSNVCLEAAAVGRPLLVSDIPGCKETVEEKKSGFVFPAKDKEALLECAENFYRLSVKEKESMGKLGREKIEREFDRNKVVSIYQREIERILQDGAEGNAKKGK